MLYYLSLFLGAVSGLAAVAPFLALWHFFNLRRLGAKLHIAAAYVFCFFIALILSVTRVPDLFHMSLEANMNVVPFDSVLTGYVDYALNVLLFMPVGFFLPLLWRRFGNIGLVFCWGFFFSLSIEIVQLFSDRITDIDDLLMNAAGTVAGYLVWACLRMLFPRMSVFSLEEAKPWNREPYLCFGFTWVSMLVFKPFIYRLLSALVFSRIFARA
jgi:glycopeptide antibiotics resistance protein